MAILKCKMCGADLNLSSEDKIVTCDYCGSTQTVPIIDDEKILKLYARGNNLRSQYDFDKAYSLFEQIISEGKEEAEVYWNLLLCKYGITYVDDYNGGKKPTINRMSFDLIMDDPDYENVLEYADSLSREVYKAQLKEIHQIQKRIIDISKKEEPYDVFISYKETDVNGDRTEDSVIAQEIYNELTKEGYRVFLSRITLADAVGQEYEPIIYSALYSAPIMILVGTDVDYINATWVKNEWSRYLNMMKTTAKKNIIPCYKYLDAYDLPKEIRNIQSINLSKLGAIQDLIIGVNKLSGKSKKKKEVNVNPFANLYNTLTTYIEKENYPQARALIEQLLIFEPNNHDLYFYKFLSENEYNNINDLVLNFHKYITTEKYFELKKYVSTSKKVSEFIEKLENYIYEQGNNNKENKEYGRAAELFSYIYENDKYEELHFTYQWCIVKQLISKIQLEYKFGQENFLGIEEEIEKLKFLSNDENLCVVSELEKEYRNGISEKIYDELSNLLPKEIEDYARCQGINLSIKNEITRKILVLKELNYKDSDEKADLFTIEFEKSNEKAIVNKYIFDIKKIFNSENSILMEKEKLESLFSSLKEYEHIPEVQKEIDKYSEYYSIYYKKNEEKLREILNSLKINPYESLQQQAEILLRKLKGNISLKQYDIYLAEIKQYEKQRNKKKTRKKAFITGAITFVIILFILVIYLALFC